MSVVLLLLCAVATMLKPKKQLAGQHAFTVQVCNRYKSNICLLTYFSLHLSLFSLFSPHYLTHIYMEQDFIDT